MFQYPTERRSSLCESYSGLLTMPDGTLGFGLFRTRLLEHVHQGAGILGLGKLTHHLLGLPELVQHLVDVLSAGAAAQISVSSASGGHPDGVLPRVWIRDSAGRKGEIRAERRGEPRRIETHGGYVSA